MGDMQSNLFVIQTQGELSPGQGGISTGVGFPSGSGVVAGRGLGAEETRQKPPTRGPTTLANGFR